MVKESGGRILSGKVTANQCINTVTVQVLRTVVDPRIKKAKRLSKSYLVETHGQEPSLGATVEIRETKPFSKRKRFELVASAASV